MVGPIQNAEQTQTEHTEQYLGNSGPESTKRIRSPHARTHRTST